MTTILREKVGTRGWCPGALRPMESGDGLIARIRPRRGSLSYAQAEGIAYCAIELGNGLIDLTRRANLQLRGLSQDAIPPLQEKLSALDLIDENPEAEAVRNIIVSPLAGWDPAEVADMRVIAREIERTLESDSKFWQLPHKIGFSLNGGGCLALDGERADIYLKAQPDGVAIGIDRENAPYWLGLTKPQDAAAVARQLAAEFLKEAKPKSRQRMRDLSENSVARLRAALEDRLSNHGVQRQTKAQPRNRQGLIESSGQQIAVGLAAPFGRLEAESFLAFLKQTIPAEIRLSPWRTFYIAVHDCKQADALIDATRTANLIIDPNDPRLRIETCPGAPACKSATFDTRSVAQSLVEGGSMDRFETAHISGCPKGCACSKNSSLVVVGNENGIGVRQNGLAGDEPDRVIAREDIGALLQIVTADEEARAHA